MKKTGPKGPVSHPRGRGRCSRQLRSARAEREPLVELDELDVSVLLAVPLDVVLLLGLVAVLLLLGLVAVLLGLVVVVVVVAVLGVVVVVAEGVVDELVPLPLRLEPEVVPEVVPELVPEVVPLPLGAIVPVPLVPVPEPDCVAEVSAPPGVDEVEPDVEPEVCA
jgi:hypothetical protein